MRIGDTSAAMLVGFGLLASVWVSYEHVGDDRLEQAFTRALVGYAIARGLNGAISVAQGTEVAVQPAGIGLNFAPGEILDPINDLVERFSWIMMLAASSLGVQRVLLAMSGWWGVAAALAVIGVAWLALRVWRRRRGLASVAGGAGVMTVTGGVGRVFLFLLMLRLAMPAIVIANDAVYRVFLEDDYVAASAELQSASEAIGAINDDVQSEGRPTPDNASPGLIERARGAWQQALASVDIDQRLEQYRAAAENISENTIRLIVVFLMQTVVFPLVFLFVAWGLVKRLVRF